MHAYYMHVLPWGIVQDYYWVVIHNNFPLWDIHACIEGNQA